PRGGRAGRGRGWPLAAEHAAGPATGFVCLMYHNVVRDPAAYARLSPSVTTYFVGEADFAAQLDAVLAAGGWFLAPGELGEIYAGRPPTGGPGAPVVLTFDDGWRDSVEVAGPVLGRRGGQALLFVTTDFVGRPDFLDRRGLAALDPAQFTVGSHGTTHRMLS